ncbi:pseudouridine synthase, partial [Fistulina hepatica ATCC 64428]
RIAADPKRHILYIDRSVIVINKPFGLVSQRVTPMVPDGQAPSPVSIPLRDTAFWLKDDVNLARNLYPAHRLDKGTTGALLIARSRPHIRNLWGKFRGGDDNFEKKYLALVRGGAGAFSAKEGVIDRPILVKGGIPSISPFTEPRGKAKEAITEWKLLASSPVAPVSLLELKLTTGRKHQARVHCAYILQAPILGDIKYSDSHLPKSITEHVVPPTGRMFLHAAELGFERFRREGPQKRFVVRVVAPLPSDFQRICKMLRIPLTHLQAKGGLFIDGKRMPAPRFDVV